MRRGSSCPFHHAPPQLASMFPSHHKMRELRAPSVNLILIHTDGVSGNRPALPELVPGFRCVQQPSDRFTCICHYIRLENTMSLSPLMRLRALARRAGVRSTLLLTLPAALSVAGALTIATAVPTASDAQAITLGDIQPVNNIVTRAPGRIAPPGIVRQNVSPPNPGITREDLGLNQRPPNFGITREDLGLNQRPPNQGITREDLGLDQRPPNKGISREDVGLGTKRPAAKGVNRDDLRPVRTPAKRVTTAPRATPSAQQDGNEIDAKEQRKQRRDLKRAQKRERLDGKRVKRDRKFDSNGRKRLNREYRRKHRAHGFKVRRNNRHGSKRRSHRKRRY